MATKKKTAKPKVSKPAELTGHLEELKIRVQAQILGSMSDLMAIIADHILKGKTNVKLSTMLKEVDLKARRRVLQRQLREIL